jgi:hypothetical protein
LTKASGTRQYSSFGEFIATLPGDTMTRKSSVLLLATAAGVNLMWAGAATFRVLVDLPARHRLGPLGFAELSRATDLARGLVFYPVGAIGSAALAATAWFFATRTRASPVVRTQTATASVACLLVLAVTAWAASIMFHIGAAPADPELLTRLAERFVLLTNVRAVSPIWVLSACSAR